MRRYLQGQIEADLKKKMVFLGGPRQVGKTTLARQLIENRKSGTYFNWDDDEDRSRLIEKDFNAEGLLVFDEVHKYRRWRNWIKGIFDKNRHQSEILVTGSARLDLYRFGGDSLQGRYFFIRLHPLSAYEIGIQTQADLQALFDFGGFPEPFLSQSKIDAKRWSRDYRARLVRQDLASLESLQSLDLIERLLFRLPELVGSPLSINALREDLQVAHTTVAKWLAALERNYALFRLPPLGSPKIQAVKKEQKHYHFDWSLVQNESLRFENMIACHLLKWVHYREDCLGETLELRYFRDRSGREVDFVILEDSKPTHLIECKLNDAPASPHLVYLSAKFPKAEALQIHMKGSEDRLLPNGIRVIPANRWLKNLV